MTRRRGALLAVAGVGGALIVSSCRDVVLETGTKALSQAGGAACNVARGDIQRAVEAYTMLEGKPPKSEADLVPDYLIGISPLMDIDAHGNIVAARGSGCT